MTWTKVAEKGDIQSGSSKEFEVDGKKIAVFNQDGFHALDGICQHQDGSIAPKGKIEGDIVECPLHFWHYNIKTGELMDYLKGIKLQKYEVVIRDYGIYVYA
jgi:nitrite reductase/ring-hydroxylating ferredoxin subunit